MSEDTLGQLIAWCILIGGLLSAGGYLYSEWRLRRERLKMERYYHGPVQHVVPKGWRCKRDPNHDGPCALEPTWRTRIVYFILSW